ncbi:MAG: hypothetical protein ACJAQT_003151 [Akkermansiaceae bacterium]|jgi:hypothetical protein
MWDRMFHIVQSIKSDPAADVLKVVDREAFKRRKVSAEIMTETLQKSLTV